MLCNLSRILSASRACKLSGVRSGRSFSSCSRYQVLVALQALRVNELKSTSLVTVTVEWTRVSRIQ